MHIIGADTGKNLSKINSVFPQPIALSMKIMTIAPNFIVLILIIYVIFLTGITDGAVVYGGIVLYTLSKNEREL